MKTLNVRLVATLLGSGLILFLFVLGIPGLRGWWGLQGGFHGYMVRRNAGIYLDQAEQALERAEEARESAERKGGEETARKAVLDAYAEAVQKYTVYLGLMPDDNDVWEQLGLLEDDVSVVTWSTRGDQDTPRELRDKAANAGRWRLQAARTLESVLRQEREVDRPVARRKLVDIYVGMRRYSDAKEHLRALLEKSPEDGELLAVLGTCEAGVREYDKAAESLKKAIENAPEQVDAYQLLAELLADRNRLNGPAEADQVMKKLLESNPDSSRARLVYGQYLGSLARVRSVEDARRRPLLLEALEAMVPAVLMQAVEGALEDLKLAADDPDARLLAEKKAVLAQAVEAAVEDLGLVLDDPNALVLAARRGAGPPATDAKELDKAKNKALKALESEAAAGDRDALLAADKRGVLVDAMERALETLHDPVALLSAARGGVLGEAVTHALRVRQLVADGRGALKLADEGGILVDAMQTALRKAEGDPAALRLTANRQVLADAVSEAIRAAGSAGGDGDPQSLAANQAVLVDAMKRALTDRKLASGDRDVLLQDEGKETLASVMKRAVKARDLALAKEDLGALLLAAQCSYSKREHDRARQYAQEGITRYPKESSVYSMLAEIESRAEDAKAAISVLEKGLKATNSQGLRWDMANRLIDAGEVQRAEVAVDKLQEAEYPEDLVGYLQARIDYAGGRWLAAIKGRKRELVFSSSLEPQRAVGTRVVSKNLRAEFKTHGISLSDDASVLAEGEGKWRIMDESGAYEVTSEAGSLHIYRMATPGFEQIRGGLTRLPELLKKADLWTARCYGRLENVDQELRAYRRALDTDPLFLSAREGLARALARAGQIEAALREYQQLMQSGAAPQAGWLPLAELLFRRNMRREPDQRDWKQVENALDQAAEASRGAVEVALLRAQARVAQADEKKARAKQAAAVAQKQQEALLRAQARVAQAEKEEARAKQAAADADRAATDAEQQKALALALPERLLGDAERILLEARNDHPKEIRCWVALAWLAQRKDEWDRAAQLLAEAAQKLGDSVELRLARGLDLASRPGERTSEQLRELSEQLRELAEKYERFSEAERLQLWRGLVPASAQVGDDEQVKVLCRRVAEKQANDLPVRLRLLDLARRSGDIAGIKQILEEVERIEGKGPHWLYGRALQLTLQAKEGKDANKTLEAALAYVAKARKLRPGWERLPSLAGSIQVRLGRHDQALEDYLQAIDLGDRSAGAIYNAALLLNRQQRYEEALSIIRLLGETEGPRSEELERLEINLTARTGDLGEAEVDRAREIVADSDDYRHHIWLGQLLYTKWQRARAEGQTEEAEKAAAEAREVLRRARDLADDVPQTWVTLIGVLAATGRTKEAEDAIEQARSKIPAHQRPLALAQCYESLKRREEAEQYCEEAITAAPEDPVIARYVADFYLRTANQVRSEAISEGSEAIFERSEATLKRSEAILKRIIAGEVKGQQADVVWARRRLADILFARSDRGGYQNLKRASDLIEENLKAAGSSPEDLRRKARFLAADPSPSKRREAEQILKNLSAQERTATPEDRLMLWQFYLAEGAWTRANAQMRSLLAEYPDQPEFLAAYTSALLQRNEIQEAELWLARLEKVAPYWISRRDLRTTTSLRAELLFRRAELALARAEELSKQDRPTEAEAQLAEAKTLLRRVLDLMNRYVGNSDAQPPDETVRLRLVAMSLQRSARRLTAAGRKEMARPFAAEAEARYREYVLRRPDQELVLVAFLGRQGRIDEALRRLKSAWEDGNEMTVAAACDILLKSPAATRAQTEQVEAIVEEALKKFGRPILLLLQMADLRTTQQRYQEAEDFYREVIKKNSGHYVAMNNLAVLLALQKNKPEETRKEALRLVNRAIALAGPMPAIRDSRATVYLALGQPDKALEDLKQVIAEEARPVSYFHQAQAYRQKRQEEEAMQAMEKADELGLQAEMLQPLERPAYRKLRDLLKDKLARRAA